MPTLRARFRLVPVVALLIPAAMAAQTRPAATTKFDIPYVAGGRQSSPDQQLDLYTPSGRSFPSIVFVHGGSLTDDWPAGRKNAPYPDMARAFQRAGVAVALMSYRLGPSHAWPAQPDDVAAAFAWVKSHIASRGGDSSRVFLMGHSSGGHLVAIVGDDRKYLARVRLRLGDVAGVIPMGTILDFKRMNDEYTPADRDKIYKTNEFFQTFRTPTVLVDAGPTQHIGRGLPPYLILLGDSEQVSPPILADAQAFVAKAVAVGGKASFLVIPDRTHLGMLEHLPGLDDPAMRAILGFIRPGRRVPSLPPRTSR